MKRFLLCLVFCLAALPLYSQEKIHFMDNTSIGARSFIEANPGVDGRGVVIFILDNSVDPEISGLRKTTEGLEKVIDIQDFSGQLVLPLRQAQWEKNFDKPILVAGAIRLSGAENLRLKPVDNKFYLTEIDENSSYRNSGIKDLNGNDDTKDKFFILAFKVKASSLPLTEMKGKVRIDTVSDVWVYYVDENNNGMIDDETPKLNYKYNYDTFSFEKAKSQSKQLAPFTLSANISSDGCYLVVNSGDGSHGSHCAGIASGHDINNFAGNDGIAPGASIVSLKIGSNLLSGGSSTTDAMKKAYQYGVEFMKEAGYKFGVFSMSYGIGAETPGQSEIEQFLNKFTLDHPNIVIVTSNGNNGPGINSTGNPAGADGIISVGAIISPETIKDLYGSPRKTNWITHFSSRGGETSKPDIVAPGAAASTVPNFEHGDAFWGTSMACPQVAGASALLLCAALRDSLDVNGSMIKKAIKYSAEPLPGYTPIDYGMGLVNVPKAYKMLKILAERKESEKIWGYDISTANSFYPDIKGPAAFWKANGYYPSAGDRQTVTVKSIFPAALPEADKEKVYRVLNLKTDSPWLDIDKSRIYLKGSQPANFNLIYNHDKLTSPGVHVARVYGYPVNEPGGNCPDFDMQASVVIPHFFDCDNSYRLALKDKALGIGDIERIFVALPSGASAMNVRMSPVEDKSYGMALYAFSPDGKRVFFENASDVNTRNEVNFKAFNGGLQKGIWEIIPYCFYQSRNSGHYNLEICFYGITSNPEKIEKLSIPLGSRACGTINVINEFSTFFNAVVSGAIDGYSRVSEISQSGRLSYSKKIRIGDDISKASFEIDMANEEFNKFTDIAVNIYDEAGNSVTSTGISRKSGTVTFFPPAPGNYTFEIYPGFTSTETMNKEWKFTMAERYFNKSPISLKAENQSFRMPPGLWHQIRFSAEKDLPVAPDGYSIFGALRIIDTDRKMLAREIEIILK